MRIGQGLAQNFLPCGNIFAVPKMMPGIIGVWVRMAVTNAPSKNGCKGRLVLFLVPSGYRHRCMPMFSVSAILEKLSRRLSSFLRSSSMDPVLYIIPNNGTFDISILASVLLGSGIHGEDTGISARELWLMTTTYCCPFLKFFLPLRLTGQNTSGIYTPIHIRKTTCSARALEGSLSSEMIQIGMYTTSIVMAKTTNA